MKVTEGQISLFDFQKTMPEVKPCECGNTRLAVRYTGCGIPIYGYNHSPLVYEHYLFCIFCPICWRVATTHYDWRSNKLTIEDALKDWNKYPHRIEETQVNGRYGHKYYADRMNETLEMFPSVKKILGGNWITKGAENGKNQYN